MVYIHKVVQNAIWKRPKFNVAYEVLKTSPAASVFEVYM